MSWFNRNGERLTTNWGLPVEVVHIKAGSPKADELVKSVLDRLSPGERQAVGCGWNQGHVAIVKLDGTPVGCAICNEGEIAVGVIPNKRQLGVAKTALGVLTRRCPGTCGARTITAETTLDNRPVLDMARRLGADVEIFPDTREARIIWDRSKGGRRGR